MSGLAVLAVIGALVYYVSLRVHPYTYCRRCNGAGKNAGSTRKRYGKCRSCGGSGRKDRLGVRLLRR